MLYDRYKLFKAVSIIFKLLDRSVGLLLYLVTEASRSRYRTCSEPKFMVWIDRSNHKKYMGLIFRVSTNDLDR